MASSQRDVVVRFLANTQQLDKGGKAAEGRLQGIATSLQGIAALGAVVAGVNFFKTAIDEARDAERTGRKTEAVLRSTGQQAHVTADQVGELAESLSNKAGVDDEVIQQGENVLLTFTKIRNEVGEGNNIFDQTTAVSLDMAAALDRTGDAGASLQENIIRVGKALNDPIRGLTALTKVGVSFTEQQRAQVTALVESGDILGAQKIILRELQTEFGGMAEASADSTDKAIVSWGNLAESVGMKVMPAVNAVSDWALRTGVPALGSVADTVGDVVIPAFGGLVSVVKDVIELWQDLPSPVQNAAIAMGLWAVAGGRVQSMLAPLRSGTRGFGDDVRTAMGAFDVNRVTGTFMALEERLPVVGRMGESFRRARGDVSTFGSTMKGVGAAGFTGMRAAAGGLMGILGGPFGLALAGVTAAVSLFTSSNAEAEAQQQAFADASKDVAKVLQEENNALNEKTRTAGAAALEEKRLLETAEQHGINTALLTDAYLGNNEARKQVNESIRGQIQALNDLQDAALDPDSETFDPNRAAGYQREIEALQRLQTEIDGAVGTREKSSAAIDREARAAREATAAQYGVAGAQSAASQSTNHMKVATEELGGEYDDTKTALENLTEALRAYNGEAINAMEAEERWFATEDQLTESIKRNGTTLDINTEKGRENRDNLQSRAQAAKDMFIADLNNGVAIDKATAKYHKNIGQLKASAGQMGLNEKAANEIIDTYGAIPKDVSTKFTLKGVSDVDAKLNRYSASQYLLSHGTPITPANLRAVQKDLKMGSYATGGEVTGPGSATSDDILAWLSNGEFVQRAAAVQYYGPGFMAALNDKQIPREALPGYAKGGAVTWPFGIDISKTKIPDPIQAAIAAAGSVGGGSGVQRWAPLVLQVLRMLGQSSGLLPNVLRRMNQESGGNPRAINLWDSNARKGTPSIGLMQTIGPTFAAYAGPFRSRGIYDPLANIYAGLNYAINRYGSLKYAMDKPGGYRNGGWLMPGQLAYNETRKPEAVFNERQLKAMEQGGQTVEKHYHLTTITQAHQIDVPTQFARMEAMEVL
ncbi:transglycosylase SLT domain-containing protein [Actinophytocola sp. NPDC049390]|uniref:transglycosylase SLT domain-containing protein n=1 Tax=Actinophytocola sp. NPDC049390 TaxID=3363894 RepID=UPI0037A6512D